MIFEKNKIHFKYIDAKFKDIYPPIESKKILRPCIKKFNDSHKDKIESLNKSSCPFVKIFNTARCPGIIDLISIGYILRLHRDIRITTNGKEDGFKWDILHDEKSSPEEDPTLSSTVSYFSSDQFSEHYKLSENSLNTLIKINLPWRIKSKRYNFLILQPSYFEESRFSIMNGVLNSDYSPQLNVILEWRKLNAVEILKAGTPLCHIIPILKKYNDKIYFSEVENEDINNEQVLFFQNRITNY